jgi:hypothetical protein
MSKAITWIIVLAIVIGGIWYFWGRGSAAPSSTQQGQGSSVQQGATGNDTSDAALQQDAASVDTQLQAASADTNAAGSFNDTPVQQTE